MKPARPDAEGPLRDLGPLLPRPPSVAVPSRPWPFPRVGGAPATAAT
jgi:hypothetical protein